MNPAEFDYLQMINAQKSKLNFLAGTDEVGRGPLAGPVVACSAGLSIKNWKKFNPNIVLETLLDLGVTDSKKLKSQKRLEILDRLGISIDQLEANSVYELIDNEIFNLSFAISEISPSSIDSINILNASLLGMRKSFELICSDGNGRLLIDGNKTPKDLSESVETETVIKGDSKSLLIALASIIAKEYRDRLMTNYAVEYPGYGLERHAGYPTKTHRAAIEKLGITPIHRKSFKGVKEFLPS